MKKSFVPICFALIVTFSSTIFTANGDSIEHNGWIDFNKNGQRDIYEDPTQPIANRVQDLLSRMTLEEKIGQLEQGNIGYDEATVAKLADRVKKGGFGSFLKGTAQMHEEFQHIAVEQSRLGIPLIFGEDVIHGYRTIFPIPLAMACAWEPELFEKAETVAAREASANGINWTFAPMVDLARDARWGRIAEGYGEDPFLGSEYAAAAVRGFQGENLAELKSPDHVVACLKHFAAYGAAEGGRDYDTAEVTEFTLRNFYLPQYIAGINAGALTVMSAYSNIGGMPASANRHLLTDVLRGEWKFPGFVVSDYAAVAGLISHGLAADDADAATRALTAGVDMEMTSGVYRHALPDLVKSGKVPQAILDEAVRRILTVKFAKGLFDHPFTDPARQKTDIMRPADLALAREIAAKSCVLLKNENAALPLTTNAKNVALIGPFAEARDGVMGCWGGAGKASDVVPLSQGLRAALPASTQLNIAKGCAATSLTTNDHDLQAALNIAKNADTIILALGEPSSGNWGAGWSGEDQNRSDLNLPGKQEELLDKIVALGKPVIVVLFNGRPLSIPHLQEKATAILEAWNLGIQSGNGVADVLTGKVNPSGRLTTSFPYTVGQEPLYYNHPIPVPGQPANYHEGTPMHALYPFGYGLSYTTFAISDVKLSATQMPRSGQITASATVQNTGSREGDEIVQLYIHAHSASAGARPIRELRGFQKVHLAAGESRVVNFTLDAKTLGYYDTQGRWLLDPAKYRIWITQDSASGKPVEFRVVE